MIDVILYCTGIMLFSYWLNYCMGNPLADDISSIDVGAIFFFVPMWLAQRRIRQVGLKAELQQAAITELGMTKSVRQQNGLKKDHKRFAYVAGREFFTWEKSILCPICFHWWMTVLFCAVCLSFDLLHVREHYMLLALTYLVNHFFIRKIV